MLNGSCSIANCTKLPESKSFIVDFAIKKWWCSLIFHICCSITIHLPWFLAMKIRIFPGLSWECPTCCACSTSRPSALDCTETQPGRTKWSRWPWQKNQGVHGDFLWKMVLSPRKMVISPTTMGNFEGLKPQNGDFNGDLTKHGDWMGFLKGF